jgi:hypothetical protein
MCPARTTLAFAEVTESEDIFIGINARDTAAIPIAVSNLSVPLRQ